MKKLIFGIMMMVAVLMVMGLPVLGLAEGSTGLPEDPFTWETLATLAGATMATVLIVELLKLPLDKVWKIPTRVLVYFIALGILLLGTVFTSGLDWNRGLLTAVNAVIVALAAMGTYEVSFRKLEKR